MGFFSTWLQKLHETFIETQYWKLMLEGFGNTIVITLGDCSSACSSAR